MRSLILVMLFVSLFSLACSLSVDMGDAPDITINGEEITSGSEEDTTTETTNQRNDTTSNTSEVTSNSNESTTTESGDTSNSASTTSSDTATSSDTSTETTTSETTEDRSNENESSTTSSTESDSSESSENESSESSDHADDSDSDDEEGEVTDVVDGDTVVVSVNGQSYTVNYAGVDIPDGAQGIATELNRQLVQGQKIRMEAGPNNTNAAGELMRYVHLGDGRMVNEELIRSGVGKASPDSGGPYTERFMQGQNHAQANGLGFWGNQQPAQQPPASQPGQQQPAQPAPGGQPGGGPGRP